MTDLTYDTRQLAGRTAVDRNYSKIGTIDEVYVNDATAQPEWLAIKTGLFGTKLTFAPLSGALAQGDEVVVPYDADVVTEAPNADDLDHLSSDEVVALYDYYDRLGRTDASVETDDRPPRRGPQDNTSGPQTDDAMTRSEDQLDVNKRTRQTGTARLRQWIETEDVEIRVPIRREKVRMVTEPITLANRDKVMGDSDLTAEEHEVVLSEYVVDVHKRVVPKERVRLETEIETDEVAVDDTVRKERIDFEQGEGRGARRRDR